jgi:DNA-binding CsgD family transcriptional regulator
MYEPYGPIRRAENINPTELPPTNAGRGLLAAELGRQAIEHITEPRMSEVKSQKSPFDDLTDRERAVLELVAEGFPNAGIGKHLWIEEQTVKFHLSNTYRKLGVTNRTEASKIWFQHRLEQVVTAVQELEEKERAIREAGVFIIRAGVILGSVPDELLDHPVIDQVDRHLEASKIISITTGNTSKSISAGERKPHKRPRADKLVLLIEERLGKPLGTEERDTIAEEIYGNYDGATKEYRRRLLSNLIRSGSTQKILASRGISLSIFNAREYFQDRSRSHQEQVLIFERAASD